MIREKEKDAETVPSATTNGRTQTSTSTFPSLSNKINMTNEGFSMTNKSKHAASAKSASIPSEAVRLSSQEGSSSEGESFHEDGSGEVTDVNEDHEETPQDEVKRRRREKRLEMNRKSARERRKRKRLLIEELQQNVSQLTAANTSLNDSNLQLRAQIAHLKQQVALTCASPTPFGVSAGAMWNQPQLAALAMANPAAGGLIPGIPPPISSAALLELQLQQNRASALQNNVGGVSLASAAASTLPLVPAPGEQASNMPVAPRSQFHAGLTEATPGVGLSVVASRRQEAEPKSHSSEEGTSHLPPKKRERE